MLFLYNALVVLEVNDVITLIENFSFARLVLELGTEKTLEWLVKRLISPDIAVILEQKHAYLPLTEVFVRKPPEFP